MTSLALNAVYQGDCLDLLPRVSDASIDLILCDLPYGTTQNRWDSIIPLEPLWAQYKRVITPHGVIVLFAQTPFDKVLGASNLSMLRYEWIWDKTNATGFMNARRAPLKRHENILVFAKAAPVYNPQFAPGKPYTTKRNITGSNYGAMKEEAFTTVNPGQRYPTSLLQFPKERGFHPTQKPVALLEYLIFTYTQRGQVVLDNTMGSGSTIVAAIQTDRQYLGFELDEHYYRVACERIEEAHRRKQLALQQDILPFLEEAQR